MLLKNNRAFTLIELLVVVLIIGILSAIALPQYQKAVMKARFVELKTGISSYISAADMYVMINGYPYQTTVNLTPESGLMDKEFPRASKIGTFAFYCTNNPNFCYGQFYTSGEGPFAGCGMFVGKYSSDLKWKMNSLWGNDTFKKLACDWWINEFGGDVSNGFCS